jgi:hypothetical protein
MSFPISDDWLVRGTAWCALVLYVSGEVINAPRNRAVARVWLTAFGCAALLVHIFFAFHYRYLWSHSTAYNDTAAQTAAITGFNWGGGIYINYLFALVWIAEVGRSWIHRHETSVSSWTLMTRGFFLFMFVNAAVIFVRGPARWFGLACCLGLAVAWRRPSLSKE